jgi:metallo-beta-lactamase family protein
MNITFLGAAREVTGSCYLVEATATRFLVDCGMVQGGREAPARNRKPSAFDPKSIDFVLPTHAHIDLLSKLTRAGFQGPIYITAATTDLLRVMLPDSAHIQQGDAVDFDHLVDQGFISAQDVRLFTRVDAAEEIVAVLEAFYGGKPPSPEAAQG